MTQPFWLSKVFILAIHSRLLAEHGGDSGLRDEDLLDSALSAPANHHVYDNADVFTLAAAYEPDAVLAVLALSRGEMTVEEFAQWLKISSVGVSSLENSD